MRTQILEIRGSAVFYNLDLPRRNSQHLVDDAANAYAHAHADGEKLLHVKILSPVPNWGCHLNDKGNTFAVYIAEGLLCVAR